MSTNFPTVCCRAVIVMGRGRDCDVAAWVRLCRGRGRSAVGGASVFDVYLELRVTLNWKAGLPQTDAVVYVRLIGDLSGLSSPQGDSWRVVGRLDRRLAHIGPGPYRWRAEKTVQNYTIYLETAHGHPWVKLLDFPEMPNRNSWGKGFASNVRIPEHAIIPTNLQWGVRTNSPQHHLDDPLDHMTIWSSMLRPSGWSYDTLRRKLDRRPRRNRGGDEGLSELQACWRDLPS